MLMLNVSTFVNSLQLSWFGELGNDRLIMFLPIRIMMELLRIMFTMFIFCFIKILVDNLFHVIILFRTTEIDLLTFIILCPCILDSLISIE
jgi:hypothetical protein